MSGEKDPFEDLRLIGRGARNLAGKALEKARQALALNPNVQLGQLLKERYDGYLEMGQTPAQAEEMLVGYVRGTLKDAIAAEKAARELGEAPPPASEEKPSGDNTSGEDKPSDE